MLQEAVIEYHQAAAGREDEAAVLAACEASASAHRALAEIHRLEAAKAASVKQALRIAFGE